MQSAIVAPSDRHEGDDVDRAEAGMFARVRAQVDRRERLVVHREDGGFQRGGVAGEREDRAVVRRIRGVVEQPRARHASDRRRDRIDHVAAPALADVGNALDDLHATLSPFVMRH
jgi:hypothetical protein